MLYLNNKHICNLKAVLSNTSAALNIQWNIEKKILISDKKIYTS